MDKPPTPSSGRLIGSTIGRKQGHSPGDSLTTKGNYAPRPESPSAVPPSAAVVDTVYVYHRAPQRRLRDMPPPKSGSAPQGRPWAHDGWTWWNSPHGQSTRGCNNIPRCSSVRTHAWFGGPRGGSVHVQFEAAEIVGWAYPWLVDADPVDLNAMVPRVRDHLEPLGVADVAEEGVGTRLDLPVNIAVPNQQAQDECEEALIDLRRSLGLPNAYVTKDGRTVTTPGSLGMTNASNSWSFVMYEPAQEAVSALEARTIRAEVRFLCGRDIEKFIDTDVPRTLPGIIYGFRFAEAVTWFVEKRLGLYELAPPERTDEELIAGSRHGYEVQKRLLALLRDCHRRGVSAVKARPPKRLSYAVDGDGRCKGLERDLARLRALGLSIHSRHRGALYRLREAVMAAWREFERRRPPAAQRPKPPPNSDRWFREWRAELSDAQHARKLRAFADAGGVPDWLSVTPAKLWRWLSKGGPPPKCGDRPVDWPNAEIAMRYAVIEHVYRWRWTPDSPPLVPSGWSFTASGCMVPMSATAFRVELTTDLNDIARCHCRLGLVDRDVAQPEDENGSLSAICTRRERTVDAVCRAPIGGIPLGKRTTGACACRGPPQRRASMMRLQRWLGRSS